MFQHQSEWQCVWKDVTGDVIEQLAQYKGEKDSPSRQGTEVENARDTQAGLDSCGVSRGNAFEADAGTALRSVR